MKNLYLYIQENTTYLLLGMAILFAGISTYLSYSHNIILAYGDAESHINIAKRVVSGLTPGLAQLGGIWLPLPHLLMIPFVIFDPLWRSGLAGSIVGGISYCVSCLFIYKLILHITSKPLPAWIGFFVFALNPNILYLQATPMSELPLLAFYILSIYYFLLHIEKPKSIGSLILAGFFGFCASLSRYDGWFLVLSEACALIIFYLPKKNLRSSLEGKFVLFGTLAFFGVVLWLMWDFLILGDALYFSTSPFSAKSQQQGWLSKGELPAYKNVLLSFLYYGYTSMYTVGFWVTLVAVIGFFVFLFYKRSLIKYIMIFLLFVPFIFYWATLYLGQSVIFIPNLTPSSFTWHLFNVRYGSMMVPFVSVVFAYIFAVSPKPIKVLLVALFSFQMMLFASNQTKILSITDGTVGLSAAKQVDAQFWMKKNYDKGFILLDDYARTLSVIKSNLPISKVIYIGNKPYWDVSLKEPEKYATWIVLQKDDAVWKALYTNEAERGKLFKYFQKVYTSPDILIFKRNDTIASNYHS